MPKLTKSAIKLLLFIISMSAILISCNKYKGYSKTSTGIYYKLIMIGDTIAPPIVTDFVTADIKYFTMADSLFFSGTRTFQLTKPDYKGSIDECFLMMSVGDSASFIINADNFFKITLDASLPNFIKKGSKLRIEIKLIEKRTMAQYQKDKEEFLKWIEDFGEYEKMILSRFINQQKILAEPTEQGMYFLQITEGTGKPVEIGDIVTVNYEGRFLNGKFFDSTIKRNQPLEFVYGSEMQVIKGLEKAIGRMREGEKALVILPSGLAWGDKGSNTGIIPPFTSVIYQIEVIESVQRE